jgi:hypothetical protein
LFVNTCEESEDDDDDEEARVGDVRDATERVSFFEGSVTIASFPCVTDELAPFQAGDCPTITFPKTSDSIAKMLE